MIVLLLNGYIVVDCRKRIFNNQKNRHLSTNKMIRQQLLNYYLVRQIRCLHSSVERK